MDITWKDYTYEVEIDGDEVSIWDEAGRLRAEARIVTDFLDPMEPIHDNDFDAVFWDECGVEIMKMAKEVSR